MSKSVVPRMALWSLFITCYLIQSIVCPAIPSGHGDDNKIDTDGHKKEKSKVDQELDDLVRKQLSQFRNHVAIVAFDDSWGLSSLPWMIYWLLPYSLSMSRA